MLFAAQFRGLGGSLPGRPAWGVIMSRVCTAWSCYTQQYRVNDTQCACIGLWTYVIRGSSLFGPQTQQGHGPKNDFYQRVSIASYASAGIARAEMSVRLSVTHWYCIKTKKAVHDFMISSPSESLNILVSRNIWFVTKFDRGHPERGRFLRLGWVRTGDFGDFSTNKPPYLRNGAR